MYLNTVSYIENSPKIHLLILSVTVSYCISTDRIFLTQAGVSQWEKSEFTSAEELYKLCVELSDETEKMKLLRNIATCQVCWSVMIGTVSSLLDPLVSVIMLKHKLAD